VRGCRLLVMHARTPAYILAALAITCSSVLPAQRTQVNRPSREPHATHYFLGTSALPLERGTGWYKNTLVTLNSAAYGLTNNLSISGGVDLFSLISSRQGMVWYARAQVQGSLGEYVHLGAQLFHASIPLPLPPEIAFMADGRRGLSSGLGMITLGDERYSVTLCGGVAYDGERLARGPLLGAMARADLAASISVITEHWMLTDPIVNYPVHSLGIRLFFDQLAVDAGIAYEKQLAAKLLPIGMPFLSATLNF
jgi:hypothetical protein